MTKGIRNLVALFLLLFAGNEAFGADDYSGNPLFEGMFTADPCAIVYNDTLYVFTGHDEQTENGTFFLMRDWYVFSTADMVNWTNHGPKFKATDFSWASGNAFASDIVENNGKFYWYLPVTHRTIRVNEGFAIGVAVADHPLGPYTDAIGSALITDQTANSIDLNIDPAVYIDNGTPYLYWGSWGAARYVKLKNNMTELDGAIQNVSAQGFFEAPWIHKKDNIYYLSYASGYPSTTVYSTGNSVTGPWTYKGTINDRLDNSETNHQAIIEFKGNWYFIYHNGGLPGGGTYRRSVCVDKLEYNNDGTIKKVVRTTTGVPIIAPTRIDPVKVPQNKNFFSMQKLSRGLLEFTFKNSSLSPGQLIEIAVYTPSGIRTHKIRGNYADTRQVSFPLTTGMHIVQVKCGNSLYTKNLIFN